MNSLFTRYGSGDLSLDDLIAGMIPVGGSGNVDQMLAALVGRLPGGQLLSFDAKPKGKQSGGFTQAGQAGGFDWAPFVERLLSFTGGSSIQR